MTGMNRLMQLLPPDATSALQQTCSTHVFGKGDVLAEPGDDITRVYFPHAGIVSFMVVLGDGAIVQTLMVGRDGVVGAAQALDDRRSINKILVQVAGSASVIDRASLRDIAAAFPEIRHILAAHEQFVVADIQQTAACNARHSLEARMARWILRMRDLIGDELELTQDALAAMIGVRRTGVSDIAAAMQERGIIRYVRGRMHVADAHALAGCSCECHGAVRDNYLSLFGSPWPDVDDRGIATCLST